MSKSILEKRSDLSNRTQYFTEISVSKGDVFINDIIVKIDTGASCTILGLDDFKVNEYKEEILKHGEKVPDIIVDATGHRLDLIKYVFDKVKLTDKVELKNCIIYFSKDLSCRSVLGMDILSLFNFSYVFEPFRRVGSFMLVNYEETLQHLDKRYWSRGDIINPRTVMAVEEFNAEEYLVSKCPHSFDIIPKSSIYACRSIEDCEELLSRLQLKGMTT